MKSSCNPTLLVLSVFIFGCTTPPEALVQPADVGGNIEVVVAHGHAGPVYDVRFLGDGRIATAAWDGTARLWDLASGRELLMIDDAHTVNDAVTASIPVGDLLITGGVDGFVRAWDQDTGKLLKELPAPLVHITVAAVSPDQKRLAVSSEEIDEDHHTITLYSLPRLREKGKFQVPRDDGHLYDMSFSPDGQSLALGMENVRLYSLQGKSLWPPTYHGEGYGAVVFTPDGKQILAVTDKRYEFYDAATGDLKLSGPHNPGGDSYVTDVAMHPDGHLFTTGDLTKTLNIRRVEDGELVHQFELTQQAGTDPINAQTVAFSDDGEYVAAGIWHGIYGGNVRIWSLKTHQLVRLIGGPTSVTRVNLSEDGRRLISNGEDGVLRLWDLHLGRMVEDSQTGHAAERSRQLEQLPFMFKERGGAARGAPLVVNQAEFVVKYSEEENLKRPVLVEPNSGEVVFALPMDDVNMVTASADGKRLFLARDNGTIEVWDPHQRVLVATLAAYHSDWAAYLPDGTYAVNRAGLDLVYFRRGNEVMPFDSFDLLYNRPDRLLEALGTSTPQIVGAYRAAAEKRLRKMGLVESELDSDLQVPDVSIPTRIPLETEASAIALDIEARDRRAPLQRLHVWVNGVPIFGLQGMGIEGKTWSNRIEVPLAFGPNLIEVAAQNEGGLRSHRQTMRVNRAGEKPKRTLKVLAIGVSDYPGEDFDLAYAAKDALDVTKWFDQAKGFDAVEVSSLVDGQATAMNIREARTFLEQTEVDDQVVLFFAGHGVLDESGAYRFATHDADLMNYGKGGLTFDEVETMVDGIPAQRRLLLIDTCHAGEVDEDAVPKNALAGGTVRTRAIRGLRVPGKTPEQAPDAADIYSLMRETFADLRQSTGSVVIASSGGAEFAFESPSWNNGVFTYAMLEGLSSGAADLDSDGAIFVSELRQHVSDRVQELTGGQQTPAARQENLTLDFLVQ